LVIGSFIMITTFEDLEVWKLARELRNKAYKITENFPKSEEYKLKSQLRAAATSVTANIAEGFGRFHYQENIQFCRQARGSLFEVVDHLITSNDEGYLSKKEYEELKSFTYRIIKVLNGYIASIKKQKELPNNSMTK